MFRRIRLLAPILAVLLLVTSILPVKLAAAASEELTTDEAVALLQEYRIVQGDNGNLMLDDLLTRAQAAAIFVRAMNASAYAELMADTVPFTDARGHWGAGEIAVAKQLRLMEGDGNGLFRPDDQITYAEVLTVLLRMVEREPAGAWDPNVILGRAQQVGIAPSGILATLPAVRRQTFWALAATMTEVELAGQTTLLRRHYDMIPPELTLDKVTSPTTADSITLSGKAAGAHKVLVNGKTAQLDKKSGKFSYKATLSMGTNEFQVEAFDRARNRATETVSVERNPEVSKIEIKGPATIAPKSTQKLEIKAYDPKGKEVALGDVTAALSEKSHTFDVEKKTLTTSDKKGKATLTLTSGKVKATYTFEVQGPSSKAEALKLQPINKGVALAPDKEYEITVHVVDKDGKVVTDDFDRSVRLQVEDLIGVKVTPTTAQTSKGVASFKVKPDHEGTATIKVTSSGLDSDSQEIEVLSSLRIVLSSSAKTLVPDGTSTAKIRATLTDDTGKAVTNSKSDIEIELRARNTDGVLEDVFLTIPRGKSASGDAVFRAGYEPGTVRIQGSVDSSHDYSVQSLEIPVEGKLSGARIEMKYTPANPEPGKPVTVTLRVLDEKGRTDTKASYAFQIKLSTSNRDPVSRGIPDGVQFTFKGSEYYPVDDGRRVTDPLHDPYSVVGRTSKGVAEMTLMYNGSGIVRLTPVVLSRTTEAYNPVDGFGAAASTRGYGTETLEVKFTKAPKSVELVAVTQYGEEIGEVYARPSRSVKLVAKVLDEDGRVIPGYSELVTLTRIPGDRVTNIEDAAKMRAKDGEATFKVWVYRGEGSDKYQVTVGKFKSELLTITVDNN